MKENHLSTNLTIKDNQVYSYKIFVAKIDGYRLLVTKKFLHNVDHWDNIDFLKNILGLELIPMNEINEKGSTYEKHN